MVSDRVRDAAVQAAHDIAAIAAATATKRTGNYASGFKVNSDLAPRTMRGKSPRAYAQVYNSDPAAAPQEFGDRWGNPGHRTLRKAGDAIGNVAGVG